MLKHNANNRDAAAAIENWRMSKTGTASNRSGATTRTTVSSKRGAEKSTIIKEEMSSGHDSVMEVLGGFEDEKTHSLLTRIFSLTEPSIKACDPTDKRSPVEMLTVSSMRQLESGFNTHLEIKNDGDVVIGIDMEGFVKNWLEKVCKKTDVYELRRLFVRIDAQCTGYVSWKDFIGYTMDKQEPHSPEPVQYKQCQVLHLFPLLAPMCCGRKKKTKMTKHDVMKSAAIRIPYPDVLQVRCPHREKESIIKISMMPVLVKEQNNPTTPDVTVSSSRYVTLTSNGILRLFDGKCSIIETFNLRDYHDRTVYNYLSVTDMVWMGNMRMIAVSFAHNRSIHFYTMMLKGTSGWYKMTKDYDIRGLDHAPMCMEYITCQNDKNISYLAWGDTKGHICILNFTSAMQSGPFGKPFTYRVLPYYDISKVKQGKYSTVNYNVITHIHDNWVVSIKHCAYLSEFGFISCSRNSEKSLYYGDLTRPAAGSSYDIKRGVSCIEYCETTQSIYVGCVDGKIRVIRPTLGRITNVLPAHMKAVTSIVLDERRDFVISAGEDHHIMVHSTAGYNHIQSMEISNLSLSATAGSTGGVYNVSAMYVNQSTSSLLIGTHFMGMLEYQETVDHTGSECLTTHDGPCNKALYNPLFDMVVTCDANSRVCLWNPNTGKLILEFIDCHQKSVRRRVINQEIMTLSFDPSYRRLITGAHDGTVHIWNVNNGKLLRRLDPRVDILRDKTLKVSKGSDDVAGVIWSEEDQKIAVCLSGSRMIYTYNEELKREDCQSLPKLQHSDINCMVYLPPTLIATCCSEGDIIIRSLQDGRPFLVFNASVSTNSILDQRQGDYRTKVSGAAAAHCKQTTQNDLRDSMLPVSEKNHKKYSSIQALDADFAKPGVDRSNTYMFDEPRYEKMALAAALGSIDSDMSDLSSLKMLLADKRNLQSNLKSSIQHECERTDSQWMMPVNNSVDCMIVLLNRVNTKETATLVVGGADGWVRAWSTTIKGGLLGQFNAAHNKEESILCLATDLRNEYLFTGDSEGYIKVWDIMTYCLDEDQLALINSDPQFEDTRQKKYETFILMQRDIQEPNKPLRSRRLRLKSQMALHGLPCAESDPIRTLKSPPLLNSFRAHVRGITSITYAEDKKVVITSSADGNVRLWSVTGFYVGHFGQSTPWNVSSLVDYHKESYDRPLPYDVKKVASSTTLMVWNGGNYKRWSKLRSDCLASRLVSFITNLVPKDGEGKESSISTSQNSPIPFTTLEAKILAGRAGLNHYLERRKDMGSKSITNEAKETASSFISTNNSITCESTPGNSPRQSEAGNTPRRSEAVTAPLPSEPGTTPRLSTPGATPRQRAPATPPRRSEPASTPGVVTGVKVVFGNTPVDVSRNPSTWSDKTTIAADGSKTYEDIVGRKDMNKESENDHPRKDTRTQSSTDRSRHSSINPFKPLPSIQTTPSEVTAQTTKEEISEFPGPAELAAFSLTSKYLGKAYKKCGRHKPFPKVEDPRVFSAKYAVYHALPFIALDPIAPPNLSDNVQKILQSRAAKQKEAEDLLPKVPKKKAKGKKLAHLVKSKKQLIHETDQTNKSSATNLINSHSVLPPICIDQPSELDSEQQLNQDITHVLHNIATDSIYEFAHTSDQVVNPASNYPNQTFPTDFGHLLYQKDEG